ncbi:LysE family translocator [Pelagibius sp.]|uniref:LysE family translocator n=1 Tax=Pelagibius sp. TaxID=1931238 RepID=UPI00261F2CEA|nr:LysE family translocator [Pelagibius sp.]
MPADQIVAFFVFSLVAAGTPGPSNVLLTTAGANLGVFRGLPTVLGVSLGMGVMLFLVAFGLGGLLLDSPAALEGLRWGGGAFLLWMAYKIASAEGGPGTKAHWALGFLPAAAFQWVNPKSWLVSASAAATYLDPTAEGASGAALALAGVFVAAALPSCFAWLSFGAAIQRFLHNERRLRRFNLVMGALLAASVLWILF